MDKQRLKELGGHSYNVARQQKQYEEAIDRIWRAQFKSLSSTEEHPDIDIEDAHRDEEPTDDLFEEGRTPRSEGTPWLHRDDETTSQFSRMSAKTQSRKVLKITRRVINKHGDRENQVEVIRDPKVIRQYLQKRRELDAEKTQVEALVPTGNIEEDNHAKKR
jgi:transcription initiation factor TFIID subunit 1